MRTIRYVFRAATCAFACTLLAMTPAAAQSPSPSAVPSNPLTSPPPAPGGLCAPWHSCVAKGALAAVVLYLLFLGLQFVIQARGFGKIEHQQGHPEGVNVNKE